MPQREAIAINPTGRASRMSVKTNESLTGDRVITLAEVETYNAFRFTPTAARNVDLPAVAACKGAYLYVHNSAATALSLTVRDAAAATVVVIPQNKCAIIFCDGVAWSWELGA